MTDFIINRVGFFFHQSPLLFNEMRTLVSFITVAHRNKAQHNFSFETQQSFPEHNEIF